MAARRTRVLYVTDLSYDARGRRYGDEDVALSARLRATFDVALCHPADAAALMDAFDVVVVRNSGPVIHYRAAHEEFRARALQAGVRTFNGVHGRGDVAGKHYLLELYAAGHPVIPTAGRREDVEALPRAEQYVVKPVLGADSVGLRFVGRDELAGIDLTDQLVQPRIDLRYEVSFYFVDDAFQYALHAPDPDRRWVLEPYAASQADLAFARGFVAWNDLEHGIQRVDACRTAEGDLLLVELEDLNPYLSLDRVDAATRDAFVEAMTASVAALAASPA